MGFSSLSFQKHHIQTHRILRWVLRSTACMKVYGWQRSPSDSASDSLLHTRTRIHWLALHFKNLVKSKSSHASKDCRSLNSESLNLESWHSCFFPFWECFYFFECLVVFFLFFSKMHVAGLGARRNAPLLAWDLVKTWHHSSLPEVFDTFCHPWFNILFHILFHISFHILFHILFHVLFHILFHILFHVLFHILFHILFHVLFHILFHMDQ